MPHSDTPAKPKPKNVLWIMPVVLLLGALAAFLLKERPQAPPATATASPTPAMEG